MIPLWLIKATKKIWKPVLVVLGVVGLLVLAYNYVADTHYLKGQASRDKEIAEYQMKVVRLAAATKEKDLQIITKNRIQYVDRVQKETEVQYKTHTVVRYVTPEQFNLSKGWVHTYNASVDGIVPDSILAADPTPSAVTDRFALEVTTENLNQCRKDRAQLQSLIDIERDRQATFGDSQ